MEQSNQQVNDQASSSTFTSKGVFKTFKLFICMILSGFLSTYLIFFLGYFFCDFIPVPKPPSQNDTTTATLSVHLAYALRCAFPMLMSVIAGVVMVGNKRAVTDAVDPLVGQEKHVQLEKNFLANTLEQFVIGFTLMMIIATFTESPQLLKLLPIYAAVFVVARVVFYMGYRVQPIYRALGMSSNFACLHILVVVAAYSLWSKGLVAQPSTTGHVLDSVPSTIGVIKSEL